MMRIILVLILSSIISIATHAEEAKPAYDHARLRAENPEIVSRFEFLKNLSIDRPVTLAVIGDYPHIEEFKDLIAINKNEIPDNGIDDDGNGYIDDYYGMDMHVGHGRTIAPVISGHENAIISLLDFLIREHKLVGKVKILPINITNHKLQFDEMYMKKTADAVDYARLRGADVISMSFGVPLESRPFFSFIENDFAKSQDYLNSALSRAAANNILLLAAVSNNPVRDHTSEPEAPAHSFIVISVANVNFQAQMQSAYGQNVDLAFYGTDLSVWGGHKEGYKRVKGSSYSTPLVAFSLALAKSLNPTLTMKDLPTMKNSCERKIVSKKTISSQCVFSPEKLLMGL